MPLAVAQNAGRLVATTLPQTNVREVAPANASSMMPSAQPVDDQRRCLLSHAKTAQSIVAIVSRSNVLPASRMAVVAAITAAVVVVVVVAIAAVVVVSAVVAVVAIAVIGGTAIVIGIAGNTYKLTNRMKRA